MTTATLKKKIHIKPVGKSNLAFVFLVQEYGLRPIKTQKDHDYYLNLSKELMKQLATDMDLKGKEGIRHYLSFLAPRLEEFETEKWPAKKVTGGEMLEFLRKQQGLTQKDLKKEIGEQPYVSDIEKGKKNLTTSQIEKLCKRFDVSPNVFF